MNLYDTLLAEKDNLRIMKYKLFKRIDHSFIPLYDSYYKHKAMRKKIYVELDEGIDEKNLFIEKEWEYFPDDAAYERKIRRMNTGDSSNEKCLRREVFIDKIFLRNHQECIFVFGDNTMREGCGGAAKLRNELNSYGFVTKKYPSHADSSYYTAKEYMQVYEEESDNLIDRIRKSQDKIFLISKVGAGLANKHNIWENVILPRLVCLLDDISLFNVIFLFNLPQEYHESRMRISELKYQPPDLEETSEGQSDGEFLSVRSESCCAPSIRMESEAVPEAEPEEEYDEYDDDDYEDEDEDEDW